MENKRLNYTYLTRLRQTSTAWRLLSATYAPFIGSFLHQIFIAQDRRSIPYPEILSALDDYLFELRQTFGNDVFPRTAKQYLDDWSSGESPFLSQRYVKNTEVPEVDLTAGAEKALRWIEDLEVKGFIGTESRLLTIFRLMEDLAQHTETDPDKILTKLRHRKAQIEKEIEDVEQGHLHLHDSTQIKERLYQLEESARSLLADFRQVEENFRQLDRQMREHAVIGVDGKGVFLDEVFKQHDSIGESDQGRSFRAFWDLMLQGGVRLEFTTLLDHALTLSKKAELPNEGPLRSFYDSLLLAGDRIKRVTNQLTAQLRKYLDDRVLLESRRVMELVQSIERKASNLPDELTAQVRMPVDEVYPILNLDLSRQIFEPSQERPLEGGPEQANDADQKAVPLDRLFAVRAVDERKLKRNIDLTLMKTGQATLQDITNAFPCEEGLAELVTYLKLASDRRNTVYSDTEEEAVTYLASDGERRIARLGRVIFVRELN